MKIVNEGWDRTPAECLKIALKRRLRFGDDGDIQSVRILRAAEEFLDRGDEMECGECNGKGTCYACGHECEECDGEGSASWSRDKVYRTRGRTLIEMLNKLDNKAA